MVVQVLVFIVIARHRRHGCGETTSPWVPWQRFAGGRPGQSVLIDTFIKKQFIDILHWTEETDGVLAWRFPMQDFEIQYGASLTVRESQMAVFVNEGQVADVFGPGMYKLTTQTLPVLTYLKNWDKLFESPFKSDVYFFSTRLQLGRKWGTPQPITIRDKDFGMVRLRAFGMYSYKLADPRKFYTEISGTRESYTVDELEEQLRNLVVATMSATLGGSELPFLDMAANQGLLAERMREAMARDLRALRLDARQLRGGEHLPARGAAEGHRHPHLHGHGGRSGQVHPVPGGQQHPPGGAERGRLAGMGAGLAAGVGMGQMMADAMRQSMNPAAAPAPVAPAAPAAPVAAPEPAAEAPEARLEKLKGLLDKGLISAADYDTAKAEILKKLIG
jgi:membrane protease subunit (stomatin/prohibitin family)